MKLFDIASDACGERRIEQNENIDLLVPLFTLTILHLFHFFAVAITITSYQMRFHDAIFM